MYKIVSTLTQFKNDDRGPVKDDKGNHVHEQIGCLIGLFRWPPEGVVVPDDFFADDAMFVKLVRNPGVDVFTSKDGKDWRLLELEDEDAAAGPSPSGRRAPSPTDIMNAMRAGINVTPRTSPRAQERGPQNAQPADKVRAHLEAMTTQTKSRRDRKAPQGIDG